LNKLIKSEIQEELVFMKKKGIVYGAMVLTVAGVITRILGFVYRIYLSNMIGAEGMGLYQLIMPVYSLGWSIACSGFTTTVSKLTAQERAKGEYGNMGRFLKQSVTISGSIGVILCLLLFFFAEPVAVYFLKEPRLILSLKILALSFPFMAGGSCVRGYFFGLQENQIPAINQVLEQCVRMVVIYLLAGSFMGLGIEYACAVAVVGIFAEEAVSLLYIVTAYRMFKTKNTLTKRPSLGPMQSLGILFTMALPLTFNRVTGSMLTAVEDILIPQRLLLYGLSSSEAISAFGQISGMVMPLIFFPSAVLQALSTTLVPAVSEASALNNQKKIQTTLSKSFLFTAVISMGASAVFVTFARELGFLIYKQDLSHFLIPMGLMCPFIYIQMILSGALNGLGFQVFIFRNSLISSLINIGFIYFAIPYYGMDAFIFGWFASLLVVEALEINKLRESVHLQIKFSDWILKPVLSGLAAGMTVRLIANRLLIPELGSLWGVLASICLLGLLYCVLIMVTGCLRLDDLHGIFKGMRPQGMRPQAVVNRMLF